VFQRPDKPGWWCSITTSDGSKRARLKVGRTKAEALRRHGELLSLKASGELTPDRLDEYRANRRHHVALNGAPSLATAWDAFVEAKAGKKTLQKDRERWAVLTRHLPASAPLKTLSVDRVVRALNDVQAERGLSAATRNRYAALIRSVLMLQAKRGARLGLNPSLITTSREAARERVLERSEVTALLEHLGRKLGETTHPRRRLWLVELDFAIRFGLLTACRVGELGAATWRDVDLRAGSILFRETKAGGSRSVTLSVEAIELLKRWRADAGDPPRESRVLVSESEAISRRFTAEAEAAGLVDARFHDLRRTACSRMLEAGIDARTVQAVSGHKDLGVLLRVYNRASAERRRSAVAVLGETFGGQL
jgi:integrase